MAQAKGRPWDTGRNLLQSRDRCCGLAGGGRRRAGLPFAPAPRRGAWRNPYVFEGVLEPVRAVAWLSEKGPGPGQSAPSRPAELGADLATAQERPDRSADCVCDRMRLRVQAASRAPDEAAWPPFSARSSARAGASSDAWRRSSGSRFRYPREPGPRASARIRRSRFTGYKACSAWFLRPAHRAAAGHCDCSRNLRSERAFH